MWPEFGPVSRATVPVHTRASSAPHPRPRRGYSGNTRTNRDDAKGGPDGSPTAVSIVAIGSGSPPIPSCSGHILPRLCRRDERARERHRRCRHVRPVATTRDRRDAAKDQVLNDDGVVLCRHAVIHEFSQFSLHLRDSPSGPPGSNRVPGICATGASNRSCRQ